MQDRIDDVYRAIAGDLTELESVVPNDFGGFDLTTAQGGLVRLADDDGMISLYEFNGPRTMLIVSESRFSAGVSTALIAMHVAAHMLVSAKEDLV